MRSEKQQETTALQRFGHVCAWVGNGLGALLLVVGAIAFAGASLNEPEVGKLSYRYTFSDGRSYEAIGKLYWVESDALRAMRKFRGENLESWELPYDNWKVFRVDDMDSGQIQALNRERTLAIEQAKEKKARQERGEAGFLALSAIFLGALFTLIGQALRYIFAGPRR